MEARSAEGVAAKRSEAAAIRPRAARDVDGDRKDGVVVGTEAEIVFANGAAGREVGF